MIGGRDVAHEPILERVTGPAATIISLAEAKKHCNAEAFNDDDSYITGLIAAADSHLDGPFGAVGIANEEQTWRITLPAVQGRDGVRLPVLPLVAVTAVTYLDKDEAEQTYALANLQWFSADQWAYVEPKKGQNWPAMSSERNALRITFIAGAGCPEEIKHAALMLVGHWYENREAVSVRDSVTEFPMAVQTLIGRHRRGWIGA